MNGFNFTERVRKVLALAREEAAFLHHEYVGTEHLLLGLVREGQGCGATALRNLNVQLDEIEQRILKLVKPGRAAQITGPDLPYTSRAKKVLELAMEEARGQNHKYVGTEHLLLGLLAEAKGIAAQVLMSLGATLESAKGQVLAILGTELTPLDKVPLQTPSPNIPPQGPPISVRLVLRYDNGAVVTKNFSTTHQAMSFLTTQ